LTNIGTRSDEPRPAGSSASDAPTSTDRGARLSLVGLTKAYGDVPAVRGVHLDIEPGEFLTLLGPSGSGKTTTLMMIAGFQEPTSGSIRLGSQDITRLPPERRGIGMVFQHYALFPHLRVADNVAYRLRMRGVAREEIRRRVGEALDMVELGAFASRYPSELSGGQQQRVALARAFVFRPSLILMDEPLGALDRRLREQMQLEIKRLQGILGSTVVYVTHDQDEALVMSDRIAVMNEGLVEQCAPPETLYVRPASTFVATFVGDSNVVAGRVTAVSDGSVELRTNGGDLLRGTGDAPLQPGDDVVATLRPERISVTAEGPSQGGLSGTCVGHIYAGESSRYEIETASGTILLRHQNRPDAPGIAMGARVHVTWQPGDLRVFPAPGQQVSSGSGNRPA